MRDPEDDDPVWQDTRVTWVWTCPDCGDQGPAFASEERARNAYERHRAAKHPPGR